MLRRAFIIVIALAFSATLGAGMAWAGDFDDLLKDINLEAEVDIGDFHVRLAADFGVDKSVVVRLMERERMRGGDAYMALKISRVSGKPLDAVAAEFRKSKGKGWGVIAKNLGIKPGSAEFHSLKERGGKGKDNGRGDKGKGKKK